MRSFFVILLCPMFTVYAIKSINRNYIYVGLTDKLDRRLHQHQSGQSKTTSPYKPFILFHTEAFETRIEARKKRNSYIILTCLVQEYTTTLVSVCNNNHIKKAIIRK